ARFLVFAWTICGPWSFTAGWDPGSAPGFTRRRSGAHRHSKMAFKTLTSINWREMMRMKKLLAAALIAGLAAWAGAAAQTSAGTQASPAAGTAQSKAVEGADPAKKLGAYVGKWETEGTFAGGPKISTSLECRW